MLIFRNVSTLYLEGDSYPKDPWLFLTSELFLNIAYINLQVLALILAFFAKASAGIIYFLYNYLLIFTCVYISIVGKGISDLLVKKSKALLFALELTKKT